MNEAPIHEQFFERIKFKLAKLEEYERMVREEEICFHDWTQYDVDNCTKYFICKNCYGLKTKAY